MKFVWNILLIKFQRAFYLYTPNYMSILYSTCYLSYLIIISV